jgi:two-component system nitrogen regulation response regulator GlnG
LLQNFAFPGNVRQLENICHWLTVMAPAQAIEAKDLPPEVLAPSSHVSASMGVVSAGLAFSESVAYPTPMPMTNGATPATPFLANPVAKPVVLNAPGENWQAGLEAEAMSLLASGRVDVWDEMTKRFEASLIQTALAHTRGRRIDAAHKLGIGRNTITRKIQELGLE